jgi:hypothetical protein
MEHKAIKIEHQDKEDHQDEGDEENADAEEQQQKQPPRKMTKNINGQNRDYNFVKTVKSVEELDNFRFKVIQQRNR